MAYQKPTCDCGGELVLVEQMVMDVAQRITKKGYLFKKRTITNEEGYGTSWLKCCDCGKEYDWSYKNDRIIREE